MFRPWFVPLACVAVWAGCSSLPDSYPPPAQRRPLASVPSNIPFGPMFAISDSNARDQIVRGVAETGPRTWRWTDAHPVFRFYVPEAPRAQFLMDFTLPPVTFRQTGPVTLTFRLNDQPLDRVRYDAPGELHYRKAIPDPLLHRNGINLIAIDAEPAWVSKEDGRTYGFILVRAGFAE